MSDLPEIELQSRMPMALRHAKAMSDGSFAHGDANPEDRDIIAATMAAAIHLGVMVSGLVEMDIVKAGRLGDLMKGLSELTALFAANSSPVKH